MEVGGGGGLAGVLTQEGAPGRQAGIWHSSNHTRPQRLTAGAARCMKSHCFTQRRWTAGDAAAIFNPRPPSRTERTAWIVVLSLSLSPLSASTQSFVPNWVIHRLKRGVTFAVQKRNQSSSARFFYLKEKSPLEGLNHFYLMIYSQWCRGSLNFSPISWNKKSFSLHPLKMPFQHEAYQDAPLTEVECNNRELKKGKATHGSCSAADCQYLSPPLSVLHPEHGWLCFMANQRRIHPPALTASPVFCHRAFECYDAAKKKSERRLSARRNECFTERLKFVLDESVGPVSALPCAATAICTHSAEQECGDGGFFCEGLDGWHKCPLVMPWGLRPGF